MGWGLRRVKRFGTDIMGKGEVGIQEKEILGLSRRSESMHRERILVCKICYLLHSVSLAAKSFKKIK